MKPVNTVLLASGDNVVVLAASAAAGDRVRLSGRELALPEPLGLGHKLAAHNIPDGEKIIKYGAPIGSATRAISAGEHVHLHNMQSDYLPTYTLDAEHQFHSAKS
ncbi:MAG: UxaA family hydrolase [Opitutales bacterium]|nr:UxaA family hydrolase [Opitutales bacterium]